MRLRLEYFDQNETFAKLLPQEGRVDRVVSSREGQRWVLFQFDRSVTYEGRNYDHVLLRSRWSGQELSEQESTSVFIVLVEDLARVTDGLAIDAFSHVAWGTVSIL